MRTAARPPIPSRSRPLDIWQLGRHRLVVGDASDPAILSAALGAEAPALLITSPPYGQQRAYTTGGIGDWNALMQAVFRAAAAAMRPDGQILVNLGMIHRGGEWQPYWQAWVDWMRTLGWRRFGLYTWDQGPGLPGDWNGRLAPAFEFVFHFNRAARRPNKIVPCKWAGTPNKGSGLRAADGTITAYQHAGRPVQAFRIPDSVIRITRHKGRGVEVGHPAVFPVALPAYLMRAYGAPGDLVLDPFAGSGTSILAGEQSGVTVAATELAPAYADIALARWEALHPDQPARRLGRVGDEEGPPLISTSCTRPRSAPRPPPAML